MIIQVTDERLTIEATDPVIIEAGNKALNAVNARAAAAAKRAAAQGEGGDVKPSRRPRPRTRAGRGEGEGESATSRVIRGDNPHAAGLASVWLELRKTLDNLVDPTGADPPPRRPRRAPPSRLARRAAPPGRGEHPGGAGRGHRLKLPGHAATRRRRGQRRDGGPVTPPWWVTGPPSWFPGSSGAPSRGIPTWGGPTRRPSGL